MCCPVSSLSTRLAMLCLCPSASETAWPMHPCFFLFFLLFAASVRLYVPARAYAHAGVYVAHKPRLAMSPCCCMVSCVVVNWKSTKASVWGSAFERQDVITLHTFTKLLALVHTCLSDLCLYRNKLTCIRLLSKRRAQADFGACCLGGVDQATRRMAGTGAQWLPLTTGTALDPCARQQQHGPKAGTRKVAARGLAIVLPTGRCTCMKWQQTRHAARGHMIWVMMYCWMLRTASNCGISRKCIPCSLPPTFYNYHPKHFKEKQKHAKEVVKWRVEFTPVLQTCTLIAQTPITLRSRSCS